MPEISVIVTTFNRPDYLRETLKSIMNQSFTDFEIIVVDNCSEYDFFAEIKKLKDPRIKAFQNQNDGVIALNRNFGSKKACGQYLAFCDDDDLWHPEKLKLQYEFLSKRDELSLLFCHSTFIDSVGKKMSNGPDIPGEYRGRAFFPLFSRGNFFPLSSSFIRQSIFAKFGGFSEDPEMITMEDYHLWLRVSFECRIDFLDRRLLYYRIHQSNQSLKLKRYLKTSIKITRDIERRYPQIPPFLRLRKRLGILKQISKKLIFRTPV
ncbi:glycosyltransferase family 2 protein [Candidatus Riflebacteria bacterium]